MRILTVSAFYPPYVIGGAELCAQSLTHWFAANGHEAAVLTAAPMDEHESWAAPEEGYTLYRVATPHIYPVFRASHAPNWKKPIWHAQDHYDPRNEAMFDKVIADFKPDFIHIHWISGLGYNGLKAIGRHDIPTAITLHDLAYACLRTTMFRGSDECLRQCNSCRLSAKVKMGFLEQIPRLGFISPSRSNLDTISSLLPIETYPRFHILNPNHYAAPRNPHVASKTVRLLFVGRLEKTKGINFLLELLDPLASDYDFHLTVLGKGPEDQAMRAGFGDRSWLTMLGHVPQQLVADIMGESDLLVVPSLWAENSPGVVFQALVTALPVMGSDKGGLPELIEPGVNGMLVPPGDAERWRAAIVDVLDHPEQLQVLRDRAAMQTERYDYDSLARQMLEAFEQIAATRRA